VHIMCTRSAKRSVPVLELDGCHQVVDHAVPVGYTSMVKRLHNDMYLARQMRSEPLH
jgi:hypothetical protein